MSPSNPQEICSLFQRFIRAGDIEGALSVYDRDVVFVKQSGELVKGSHALREELMPFVEARAMFEFDIDKVVQVGDIALMHTAWTISAPPELAAFVYAIEVARRQADGTWRWLIGDPFTVGQRVKGTSHATPLRHQVR